MLVRHLRIVFNESAPSIYEYPSEQSLLDQLPPEKGDFDYIGTEGVDEEDFSQPSATLKSTLGIGTEDAKVKAQTPSRRHIHQIEGTDAKVPEGTAPTVLEHMAKFHRMTQNENFQYWTNVTCYEDRCHMDPVVTVTFCFTPGGLGAYQTRYQESFEWGTVRQSSDTVSPPTRTPVDPEPKTALVEDDDTAGLWAEGATADMLF
ncbi:hypothetical protein NP493_193g04017 [Ridgeia piscesae]|uniref:Uncharacterized protein n=1 Tax=Ridgeia piscesae TaxID=27915 RepID=A0AAD9P242_RIDPI|nr:hypothetical protein NP493_193g04017 [Ridgeia piscesae]